jgi:drug/metabolite transporter (DMT)-like permease
VKYLLRWHVPKLRLVAIIVGLAGLFIMLGGDGGIPIPGSLGEWMAFIGGFIWAIATVGMRLKSQVPPGPAACSTTDDHIDPRRSALFMARSIMRDIRDRILPC